MANTVENIENAITKLPHDKLKQFRIWYEKFDSYTWDERIEKDAKLGKLDALAKMAITDHIAGKSDGNT